jgi:ribosomal protein S26
MDIDHPYNKITCCFCGKHIQRDKAIVLNIYRLEDQSEEQSLFTHYECLDQRIGEHSQLGIFTDIE